MTKACVHLFMPFVSQGLVASVNSMNFLVEFCRGGPAVSAAQGKLTFSRPL